jgi:hypothetical protein
LTGKNKPLHTYLVQEDGFLVNYLMQQGAYPVLNPNEIIYVKAHLFTMIGLSIITER